MSEQERKDFEVWYEGHCLPGEADWFRRDPDEPDEYLHPHTADAWAGWKAGRAALTQQVKCSGPGGLHRYAHFGDQPIRRCIDCRQQEQQAVLSEIETPPDPEVVDRALAQQAVPEGYSVVKLSQCAYRTKRGAIYGGTTFCADTTPLFEILEVHETGPAAMLAAAPQASQGAAVGAEKPTIYSVMLLAKALHATGTDPDDWETLRQCQVDALRTRAEAIIAALSNAPVQHKEQS